MVTKKTIANVGFFSRLEKSFLPPGPAVPPQSQGRTFNELEVQQVEAQITNIKQVIPRESEYQFALQQWPDDWLIKYKYALFMMVTGNFDDEVLAMLKDVKNQVPQNSAIDFNIGYWYEHSGLRREAMIHYQRALDIFPYYGDAARRMSALAQSTAQ